ncbi:MAG TPA: hypothetical protein VK968_20900 [Roseimicrobium sp.]|nr:hypothetical protein [Roseimicrobium sp.]
MSEPNLSSLLEPIASDVQRIRFWAGVRRSAYALTLTAFVFIGVHHFAGWTWTSLAPALYLILTVSLFHHFWTRKRLKPSFGEIARLIERDHPELASKLMAAQEQKPDPETGRLNFLQERLLREAVEEHQRQKWGNRFVERAFFSQCASVVVLALCLSVIASMNSDGTARLASKLLERMHGVEVTPGDTELESGSSLVVLARFHDQVPKGATLVLQPVSGAVQRLPLARNLGDPVFGTSLPEVRQEMTYHLEYDAAKTKSYRVKVYELPALIRADAELAYPAYTGLPSRTYEDTRRITAVEGTGLRYHLTLNKPVTSGKLVSKDGRTLELAVEPGHTSRYLVATTLMQSGKFDLRLVDADGRTNREPTEFVIEVLKNRTPELKFVMPKGDQRVSPLAEIRFEGQASDDFGVKAYGIAYSLAEKDPVYLQIGTNTAANEKRTFTHTLALEKLGVQSEQLISYHLWADDIGPDGQLRRTMTDMFFAEARPFEEVFREGKAPEGEGEPPPQSQKTMKLAKLQREILSATWKLQRRENATSPTTKYRSDVDVVKQSQAEAIRQVDALIEKSDDERTTALLNVARTSMNKALTNLSEAADKNAVPPLVPAVAGEQAAANALMKLLPREHQVVQSRSRNGGGGGEENQRQLDQLDLKQEEKNYEKEKTASSPKSPEQQEQLQVLNRLKELAQRQEAVNERVKELQTALQEAKTEAEREQIRRQLKRLKEEQQQMLADLDELRQRMDRPENQANMAEARQRLEQTREDMRKMTEELEKGATSQAAAAGTKVERELEKMRDDFRKKTAGQFTE